MGQVPSMETPTALARYIDVRNSSTCSDMISAEECHRVVLSLKWHDWYWADVMYGQSATYFYAAGIGLFTLFNIWYRVRHKLKRSFTQAISHDPLQLWSSSMAGYVGSRQFRLNRRYGYTLTIGETMIVCAMIVYFAAYYWPNTMDYGYSPPIATRAGFLAIAILPFQVMFATKWNPITILTGVSHERLQVYHRWSGWIMFDIQAGIMVETWHTDFYTYSGVICLVPQTVLVLFSIGAIRDRYYETFKSVHFVMAAWFIVLLFLHCGFSLTSAYYFICFAVTYALSLVVRWGIVLRNGFQHRANLQLLDDKMLLISIPTQLKWRPGQHFFVRFFTRSVHALTSHPFTVASAPDPVSKENLIRFYVKKHRGMTEDLFNNALDTVDVRVLLDGPYGGIGGDLSVFDRVLLVGGGSGGSFILSTLLDLVNRQDSLACERVTIVYSCRHPDDAAWFRDCVFQAAGRLRLRVDVFFHVSSIERSSHDVKVQSGLSSTDRPALGARAPISDSFEDVSPDTESIALEPMADSSPHGSDIKLVTSEPETIRPGRPDLPRHVQAVPALRGTVGIVVCGPKEMTYDVRNAVAAEQLKIIAGAVACSECYLHTEAFGW